MNINESIVNDSQNNKFNIGLIGFGCVGQGFYNTLIGSDYPFATIKKIAVKNKDKVRILPRNIFVYNATEIFADDSINLIIEAIDDAEEAFLIVKHALENKIPVVSANKKMIALHLDELINLQAKNKTALLYEASACAAIPIIRTLDTYYAGEEIKKIYGIFNGTSNFILTKIFDENKDYFMALKQAQELGFAESNPTNDVEGFDAAYKLSIMVKHAFGTTVVPNEILKLGINNLHISEIIYAKQNNFTIKLVPQAFIRNEKLIAFVLPQFVKKENGLSQIKNEYNSVSVEAFYSNDNTFIGKGAGALPTGNALLSDVNALVEGYKYNYSKTKKSPPKTDDENLIIEIYLRYANEELLRALKVKSISEGGYDTNNNYVIGYISLSLLIENRELINQSGSIAIATGKIMMESSAIALKEERVSL